MLTYIIMLLKNYQKLINHFMLDVMEIEVKRLILVLIEYVI